MSHVDTTSPITHVSLCAGYGGIDLGLKRAIPSLRTIAFSEIESFACANLVSKMEAGLLDPAPIWTDLKTFPWSEFHGCVDILSGGYPCQPFSAAGKRLGAEDPRHLWPHISAGIAAMRPGACFFENVEGHISLGLPDVLQDLAGMGYRTTWGIFSASEVGAPHQRKRVFILAYRVSAGSQRLLRSCNVEVQGEAESLRPIGASGFFGCGELADSHGDQPSAQRGDDGEVRSLSEAQRKPEHGAALSGGGCLAAGTAWPSRPGEQQFAYEPPRVVANAGGNGGRQNESRWQPEGRVAVERDGEAVGNAASPRCPRPEDTGADCGDEGQGPWREESERDGDMANAERELRPRRTERPGRRIGQPEETELHAAGGGSQSNGLRQTQPPLGRDTDGLTHRLDDAVLHVSTDNRTDELRLLGNGVVPATAERAFRVLVGELMEHQP